MKWIEVRERLHSSARYGRYWDLSFPFAEKEKVEKYSKRFEEMLNDSPYEPLLEFAVPREFIADVITTNKEATNISYWLMYSKPFAYNKSTAVLLSSRECPTLKHGECRVLVFDINKTVNLRKLKRFFVSLVKKQEEEKRYDQGGLTITDYGANYEVFSFFNEWTLGKPLSFVFREHKLQRRDYCFSMFNHYIIIKKPKRIWTTAYGGGGIMSIVVIIEGAKEIHSFSEDHDPIRFEPSDYWTILLLEHRIPEPDEPVD